MNKQKTKELEKELFDMVYQWGRVGLQTDEKCNAFQDKLKELINLKTIITNPFSGQRFTPQEIEDIRRDHIEADGNDALEREAEAEPFSRENK